MKLITAFLLAYFASASATNWRGGYGGGYGYNHGYGGRDSGYYGYYDKYQKEYDPDDYVHYDREISKEDAALYSKDYYRSWEPEHERMCSDFKPHAKKNDKCKNEMPTPWKLNKRKSKSEECKDVDCDYVITQGITMCLDKVKLYKPYKRPGKECKTNNTCGSGDAHKDECSCQTIWCVKEIKTVYKMYEKMYKGYVTVKFPCDCQCRKSVHEYQPPAKPTKDRDYMTSTQKTPGTTHATPGYEP